MVAIVACLVMGSHYSVVYQFQKQNSFNLNDSDEAQARLTEVGGGTGDQSYKIFQSFYDVFNNMHFLKIIVFEGTYTRKRN